MRALLLTPFVSLQWSSPRTVLRWFALALGAAVACYLAMHLIAAGVTQPNTAFDTPGSLVTPTWSLVFSIAANNLFVVVVMLVVVTVGAQSSSAGYQRARGKEPLSLRVVLALVLAVLTFGLILNAVHVVDATAGLAWYLNMEVFELFWAFAPHSIPEFAVLLLPLVAVLHSLAHCRSLEPIVEHWRALSLVCLGLMVVLAPVEVFVSFPLIAGISN